MIDTDDLHRSNQLLRRLDGIERLILCLLLTAMILFACLQIVLRTFFSSGLLWIDPLLRYLVLWCGLIGAVSATGQGKHIALDITGDHLPKKLEPWITLVTQLFSAITSGGLTWAAWRFLRGEIDFGGAGPLTLPLWIWKSVFPLAFGLITVKYLLLLFMQLRKMCSPVASQADNATP